MNLYFFDDAHASEISGFVRIPGEFRKCGKAFEDENPGKTWTYDVFSGAMIQLDGGLARIYCTAFNRDNIMKSMPYILESRDGLKWDRKSFVKFSGVPDGFEGYLKQPSVIKMPDGTYRMYVWLHGDLKGKLISRNCTASSRDGINFEIENFDAPVLYHPNEFGNWRNEDGLLSGELAKLASENLSSEELAQRKRLCSNDSSAFYRDPETGIFSAYHVIFLSNPKGNPRRVEYDNAKSLLRVICRRESSDGYNFSTPEIIIMPDVNDPLDRQFYYLSVHKHEGIFLGFLGDYNVADQTMDLGFAFSRDARKWERPLRAPLVKRFPGEFDSHNIYAVDSLLDAGDEYIIPYRGGTEKHCAGSLSHLNCSMGVMKVPKTRLMGLDTGTNGRGNILTKGFILTEEKITVNINVRGELRSELCDPFGKPLPGFEKLNSIAVSGDHRDIELAWKDKSLKDMRYDALSLRIFVDDGILYSISI